MGARSCLCDLITASLLPYIVYLLPRFQCTTCSPTPFTHFPHRRKLCNSHCSYSTTSQPGLRRLLRQMKKKVRNSTSSASRPDIISYTTVVHGLGLAGQLDNARKMLDEMIHQGCMLTVATYNMLIQGICKKGCVDDAVLVFDEMERKGCTPNSVTYNLVVRGLCHRGEMERAMEFVEQMKGDGCEPNVQNYTMLIRYWCEEGEIEKGLELFGKMMEHGGCLPNLDTYNVLISSMFVRKRP